MAQYQSWSVTLNEQPSAAKWNIIGSNFVYMQGALPPVGAMLYYWGDSSSVPGYWLLANGQQVNDSESPIHGLTLPNLVNKFIRGTTGNVRTTPVSGGSDTHTLTVSELPAHSHTFKAWSGTSGSGFFGVPYVDAVTFTPQTISSNANQGVQNAGSGDAHNNIPAYIGLVPIIRFK